MLNSIGILTFETVPGLNRHFWNALTADLSKVESPVLCSIEAAVTRPLTGSTDTMQTPIPVTLPERSLAGYLGKGVNVAKAFAEAYDVISGVLAASGAFFGAVFRRFGCGGGEGVASSTGSCVISTVGPDEVLGCFPGFDAASGFCEGLAAGPASPVRFCRAAISFRLASNLLSSSAFSLCSVKSSV